MYIAWGLSILKGGTDGPIGELPQVLVFIGGVKFDEAAKIQWFCVQAHCPSTSLQDPIVLIQIRHVQNFVILVVVSYCIICRHSATPKFRLPLLDRKLSPMADF